MTIHEFQDYITKWTNLEKTSRNAVTMATNLLYKFLQNNSQYLNIEILFGKESLFSSEIETVFEEYYPNKNTKRVIYNKLVEFFIWLFHEINLNVTQYIIPIEKIGKAYRMSNKGKGQRHEPDFLWALKYDKNLSTWQSYFKNFLSEQNRSYNLYLQSCNNFLDYLIDMLQITRDPLEYANVYYEIPCSFIDYLQNAKKMHPKRTGLRNNISKMNDFFDWLLLKYCMVETVGGNSPIIKEGYINPIKKISMPSKVAVPSETIRNALPTRYLHMLEEIITENDYAWPKQISSDFFSHNGKQIWNPVVVFLVLLKLKLPLRTFQLRYLDSGEGDSLIFDYNTWNWIKNPQNFYPNETSVFKGIMRKIIDHKTNKEFIGFYINTNKTNDISSDKKGYIIPWENHDVIKMITTLIEWQKKYNPVISPLLWSDISQDHYLKKKSKQTLEDMGENIFLFRDVYNKNDPRQPVSDFRVQQFWRKLLAELEKRVNYHQNNEHNPIKFIKTWEGNSPTIPLYDLHSLRVTLLTSLYQSGVPYPILSKYIAGHSTIMMTIYYTKFNYSHISNVLNEATQKHFINEQSNFNEYISNLSYEQLEHKIAYNSQDGLKALRKLSFSNYMTSDIGICPVSETKCMENGEEIAAGSKIYFRSLENGPKNCIRCRFFITGVPFLLGLTVKFNELAIQIKEKSKIYKKAEEKYETLYTERYQKEKINQLFLRWKELEIADSNYNKYTSDLDALIKDWHSLYNLIEQCLALKKHTDTSESTNQFNLITIGNKDDLTLSIEECSEVEMYDFICQSSVFYQGIEPNLSNIKRSLIINKMLLNNDIQPYFLLLDEEESLQIGNEFIKFLMLQLGRPNALDVLENKRKLKDFGLENTVEDQISKLLDQKHTFNNKLLEEGTTL